jgi:hypothetical protein
VALNQESFNDLVSESAITRSEMDRVMAERVAAQTRLQQPTTTTQEDEM